MNPQNESNKIEEDYTLVDDGKAPVVVQGNAIPGTGLLGNDGTRRSHVCCGCCCDTRRAVIVVNVITIVLALVSIVMISYFTSDNFVEKLDDDEAQEVWGSIGGGAVGFSILIALIAMGCSGCAIYGAVKFNRMYTLVGAVWYGLDALRCIVFFDISGLLLACFFCYPHVVFFQEVSSGIMSPGNYPKEEKCCCV